MKKSPALKWNICWQPNTISSAEPFFYLQLIDLIRQEFQSGNYPENHQMPSIRKLANFLNVKPYHVERAYKYLIRLNEVLYSDGKKATFMFNCDHVIIPDPEKGSLKLLRKELLFRTTPFRSDVSADFPEFNMLTLGSTYHWHFKNTLDYLKYSYVPKIKSRLKAPGHYLFPKALDLLLDRKVLNNERQLCVVPKGKALLKVFKNLVNPGSKVVCVSPEDRPVMETFSYLQLNPSFTDADGEGMFMDALEAHCNTSAVKAVLLRIEADYPKAFCLTNARWEQLKKLSEIYKFWIVIMDEDYEFSRFRTFNRSLLLNCSQVIYISVLSKLTAAFYEIGLIAGPQEFIAILQQAVKRYFIGWDIAWEQSISLFIGGRLLNRDITRINNKCKSGIYKLSNLGDYYLEKDEQLILPEFGTFGLIFFKKAIDPYYVLPLLKTKGYHQEENVFFEITKPVNAIRVSLCTEHWKALETVFRNIRGRPAEHRVFA